MSNYYLFGTDGCHLCELAEQLIVEAGHNISFEKKDIIENEDWSQKYAIRIPVLYHLHSQQELSWPFDKTMLQQFFNQND